VPDEAELIDWFSEIRSTGLSLLVVGTSARGEQVYYDVNYRRPLALLIGSERHGLPASIQAAADVNVRLPMLGGASSLNVSAATAALLYEVVRQRQTGAP
jgi:tRNA G18 (ribose-2'-O)-methylase SpoU